MKFIILVLLTLITFMSFSQDSFCDGWEEGYKNGHEDNNEFLGIIPICPIAGINQNTYRVGYNLGYKKSLKKIGKEGENTIIYSGNKDKSFCEGWEEGYKNAHEDNNKFLGITPICPIAKINQDTYRVGYSLGYKKGLKRIN